MPVPSVPLEKLGFLTIGLFDGADPRPGTRRRCEVIELGERLGFDSAWVRHRHLQYGISSPVAVLAAASQRTSRDRARHGGHPARLGEPAAAGRGPGDGRRAVRRAAQPGGQRRPADALGRRQGRALPGHRRRRGLRLRAGARGCCGWSRGEPASDVRRARGRRRGVLRPGAAALARAARPASGTAARSLRLGAVGRRARHELPDQQRGEGRGVDDGLRRDPARRRSARSGPRTRPATAARVSQGLVVIPTDSATAAQRAKYAAYVEARDAADREPAGPGPAAVRARPGRHVRARSPSSCTRTPAFREVAEVAFALPFSFEHEDYVQILTDIATRLGPALGWQPGGRTDRNAAGGSCAVDGAVRQRGASQRVLTADAVRMGATW